MKDCEYCIDTPRKAIISSPEHKVLLDLFGSKDTKTPKLILEDSQVTRGAGINYCPMCGRKLSESAKDPIFETLNNQMKLLSEYANSTSGEGLIKCTWTMCELAKTIDQIFEL